MFRRLGASEQTFCRWKAKFGGMDVSDAHRLRMTRSRSFGRSHFVVAHTLSWALFFGSPDISVGPRALHT